MILFDSLSRRPDLCPEDNMDNKNIIMLPDKLFVNFMDTELLHKIATTADLDKEVTDTLQTLLQKGPTALKNNLADWDIKFMDEKCYDSHGPTPFSHPYESSHMTHSLLFFYLLFFSLCVTYCSYCLILMPSRVIVHNSIVDLSYCLAYCSLSYCPNKLI